MPSLQILVTNLEKAQKTGDAKRDRAEETAAMFHDSFSRMLNGPPGFLGYWPPNAVFSPSKDEAVAQYQQPSKSVLYDMTRQSWLLGFSLLLTQKPFVAVRFNIEFKENFVAGRPGQPPFSNGFTWSLVSRGEKVIVYPSDDYETGIKNFAVRVLQHFEKELSRPDLWMNPAPSGGIFIE